MEELENSTILSQKTCCTEPLFNTVEFFLLHVFKSLLELSMTRLRSSFLGLRKRIMKKHAAVFLFTTLLPSNVYYSFSFSPR